MWVAMGAEQPVLSPNDHSNPPEGQQKVSRKYRNVKNALAFGKSSSQRIYPKQYTRKIGHKQHKYG